MVAKVALPIIAATFKTVLADLSVREADIFFQILYEGWVRARYEEKDARENALTCNGNAASYMVSPQTWEMLACVRRDSHRMTDEVTRV